MPGNPADADRLSPTVNHTDGAFFILESMEDKRKQIDWEKIETVYRAGVLSLREIAAKHNVSHVSIAKRAKKYEWAKDLSAKIKAKADELVNRRLANNLGNAERLVNDKEVVNLVAKSQSDIRTDQMEKVSISRSVVEGMIEELQAQNLSGADLSRLGEMMTDPEATFDKLNEAYHKVISFPGRVDSAKKLIESWAKIAEQERKINGIKDDHQSSDSIQPVYATEYDERL